MRFLHSARAAQAAAAAPICDPPIRNGAGLRVVPGVPGVLAVPVTMPRRSWTRWAVSLVLPPRPSRVPAYLPVATVEHHMVSGRLRAREVWVAIGCSRPIGVQHCDVQGLMVAPDHAKSIVPRIVSPDERSHTRPTGDQLGITVQGKSVSSKVKWVRRSSPSSSVDRRQQSLRICLGCTRVRPKPGTP